MYTAWWLKTLVSKGLKEYGITNEQFNVLRILKGKHPAVMCVKDIGCRMIEKSSNVPRIIDRLERKKLVERSTSAIDKRETVVTITDKGIALLKQASDSITPLFEEMISLDEKDSTMLNTLLEKMREKE